MHITYTLLGILIIGIYQLFGFVTGDFLTDVVYLFPCLVLSHLIDIIPSGVPRKKNMLVYMLYSTLVSIGTCFFMSYSMSIDVLTILASAIIVGWFDYLLWVFRVLKKFSKLFLSIESKLNWINIKILHPYIIKNNGHYLAHLRGAELDEEFEGRRYRSLSYEISGSNKDICLATSFLFLNHQSIIDVVLMTTSLVVVIFLIWFYCKENSRITL